MELIQNNQKKKEDYNLIKELNKNNQNINSIGLELIIEIWNGIFENIE